MTRLERPSIAVPNLTAAASTRSSSPLRSAKAEGPLPGGARGDHGPDSHVELSSGSMSQ
jgi:hypothetical protein